MTKQSLDKEQGAKVSIVRLLKRQGRNQAQGTWVGHGEMSQRQKSDSKELQERVKDQRELKREKVKIQGI